MKKMPKITESEWHVMQVLWARSPLSSSEVVDELAGATKWSPKTIKTFLSRLVRKGAVGFDVEGRAYRYFPLVGEAECAKADAKSFLKRVYGGAIVPMLAQFIEDGGLSDEEIAQLRRIFRERGK